MSDHMTRLISQATDQYTKSDAELSTEDMSDLERIKMDGVVARDAAIDGLNLLSDLFFASTHTKEITIDPLVVSGYINFLAGVCQGAATLTSSANYLINKHEEGRRAKAVRS